MQKYKPENTNTEKVEQVNIVNKYIINTYNKADKSYFVRDSDKYESMVDPIHHTIIFDHDRLKCAMTGVQISVTPLADVTSMNIHSKMGTFEKEFKVLLAMVNITPKESFLDLVICGIHGRSVILGMVNTFLNITMFRGILVTPYYLYYCIQGGIQNCLIVDRHHTHTDILIVDDYFVYDYFTIGRSIEYWDEDYREEWQKCRLISDIPYYTCTLCEYTHSREEWVYEHIRSIHMRTDDIRLLVYKYENTHGDITEEVVKRIKFVYNQDRLNKQTTKVLYNNRIQGEDGSSGVSKGEDGSILMSDTSKECTSIHTPLPFDHSTLLDQLRFMYGNVGECNIPEDMDGVVRKGSEIFNNLEICKECWMTREEWNNGGFRILKEKVLWYI